MKYPLLTALLIAAGTLTAVAADEAAPAAACTDGKGVCAMLAKVGMEMKETGIGHLDTTGLKALLNTKTPLLLFDARTGKYDDGQRLPGAKALSPEATEAEIATVLPDKAALVVTYCTNPQCPASGKLAEKLVKLGYTNVLTYHEGILGWIAAGNPVEKAQ